MSRPLIFEETPGLSYPFHLISFRLRLPRPPQKLSWGVAGESAAPSVPASPASRSPSAAAVVFTLQGFRCRRGVDARRQRLGSRTPGGFRSWPRPPPPLPVWRVPVPATRARGKTHSRRSPPRFPRRRDGRDSLCIKLVIYKLESAQVAHIKKNQLWWKPRYRPMYDGKKYSVRQQNATFGGWLTKSYVAAIIM